MNARIFLSLIPISVAGYTFFSSFDEQVNSPVLLPKQPSIRLGWPLPSLLLDNPAPT